MKKSKTLTDLFMDGDNWIPLQPKKTKLKKPHILPPVIVESLRFTDVNTEGFAVGEKQLNLPCDLMNAWSQAAMHMLLFEVVHLPLVLSYIQCVQYTQSSVYTFSPLTVTLVRNQLIPNHLPLFYCE